MHNESDTKVIERGQPVTKRPKGFIADNLPFVVAMCVLVVVMLVTAVVIKKRLQEKKSGVMEATYTAHSLARELAETKPVKDPPKFNHVIFRLGDAEIFRFTYQDSGDGLNYSFEVREGGS